MRLYINDVAVRDGFQMEKTFVPTATKVALIDHLSRTGLHKIEVTSFVSPKAVPALATSHAHSATRSVFVMKRGVGCARSCMAKLPCELPGREDPRLQPI